MNPEAIKVFPNFKSRSEIQLTFKFAAPGRKGIEEDNLLLYDLFYYSMHFVCSLIKKAFDYFMEICFTIV